MDDPIHSLEVNQHRDGEHQCCQTNTVADKVHDGWQLDVQLELGQGGRAHVLALVVVGVVVPRAVDVAVPAGVLCQVPKKWFN